MKFQNMHFEKFYNTFSLFLPNYYKISFLTKKQEEIEINDCFKNYKTFTLDLINTSNGNIIKICGMTTRGYFIINGSAYVWPFKEISIPNRIYKFNDYIEIWTSKPNMPWTMYSGRMKLFIYKEVLCLEQRYGDTKYSLKKYLENLKINDNKLLKHFENNDRFKLSYVELKDEETIDNFESPFIQNHEEHEKKIDYLCKMIEMLFSTIEPDDPNDIENKRIISTEFFVGSLCENIENTKIMNVMIKRIHANGQFIDRKNYFDYISTISKVVRGSSNHSCNYTKRECHNSHFGVYCPYRASEGESIGLSADLVPGITILNFEKETDDSLNGNCNGGKIIPSNKYDTGIVSKQILFKMHLPPVRISYAVTHVRQTLNSVYSQKPIIQPKAADICMINGQNVLVAVSSYMGLNIEDALVINQDFVNRGGFQSLIKKRFKIKKKPKETFEKIPKKFDIIGKNEIMIIKIDLNGKKTYYRNEMSASIRIIDIIVNKNDVYWEQECINKIEIGDKLSTRSGQKGVVGAIVPSCDLPYNRYGEVPDIVINPSHLPSRMTMSQLLESFFGLRAIIKGCRLNDIESVVYNYKNNQGKEYFCCGKTGNRIKNKIFFGPVFYMALHHLSYKKCRARNTGFCDTLTGQPLKSSKNSALRIGEMERDSIIARSQNQILHERFSYDHQTVSVCQSCGWLEPNFKCCKNKRILRVSMSKTTILMLYELYAQNIFPKLYVKTCNF